METNENFDRVLKYAALTFFKDHHEVRERPVIDCLSLYAPRDQVRKVMTELRLEGLLGCGTEEDFLMRTEKGKEYWKELDSDDGIKESKLMRCLYENPEINGYVCSTFTWEKYPELRPEPITFSLLM